MATRYWVGGGAGTSWNASAPTNWSATSGGANNASLPTTGDDIIFDGVGATANGASSINLALSLNSLDMNGYTGTPTHLASMALTITGNDAGTPGGTGKALRLNPNYVASATSSSFSVTSTTGTTTIDTKGRSIGNLTINGAGGTFVLGSAMPMVALSQITHLAGTFNLNGFAITARNIQCSGTGVRTWTMTGVSITLDTGNHATLNAFDFSGSNITLNASGSTITINRGTPTNALTLNLGTSLTYGSIVLNAVSGGLSSSCGVTISGITGVTIGSLTITGPARVALPTVFTMALTNLSVSGSSLSGMVALLGTVGNAMIFNVTNSPVISYTALSECAFTNPATANNSIDLGRNSNVTINTPSGGGGGGHVIGG